MDEAVEDALLALSFNQCYIPSVKVLAESFYQCGEFELALLQYEKGHRICSDSERKSFDLGR